jgi:nucleotide-binding universal stress UspA family protein
MMRRDVGHRREAAEQLVLAARVEIVDQQADANAAPGRVAQLAQELQPDAVVLGVVVLDVERERSTPRQKSAAASARRGEKGGESER